MNTDDNTKKSSDPLNSFPPEEGKQLYSKSNGIDGYKFNLGETVHFAEEGPSTSHTTSSNGLNENQDIVFMSWDILQKEAIEIEPSSEGRMLSLQVNLKNIHPDRILVVGALIYENSKLYAFKVKKLSTIGLSESQCKSINGGEFSFIIDESRPWKQRKFKVRLITHYVMN